MNIYIGNIDYEVTEQDLKTTFEAFGEVSSVKIIKDKFSGRSKGYGFVDMPDENQAKKAIQELNDSKLGSRMLVVNQARPKNEGNQREFRGKKADN